MRFILCGLALTLGLAIAADRNDPGPFSWSHYQGPTYAAMIAIYYMGNHEQPKCYGTLINFQVALVPCSCVFRQPAGNDMPTWWDHRNKKKVLVGLPFDYEALVMSHEYHNDTVKKKMMAPVHKIQVHRKCDTLFQYNVAKVVLMKAIDRTRLAWVPNVLAPQMDKLLQYAMVATAVRGRCRVYQWSDYDAPGWSGKPNLQEYDVSLTRWDSCKGLVCAKDVIPPQNATIHHDKDVCDNKVTKSRYCVLWEKGGHPFCRVVPGTPVFCHAGAMAGLAGFIHNATQWCPPNEPRRVAVMEGLDLALALLRNDMRVVNFNPHEVPRN